MSRPMAAQHAWARQHQRCHACGTRILWHAIAYAGDEYGSDAPAFCCDEHAEAWKGTVQASFMRLGGSRDVLAAWSARQLDRFVARWFA